MHDLHRVERLCTFSCTDRRLLYDQIRRIDIEGDLGNETRGSCVDKSGKRGSFTGFEERASKADEGDCNFK
jgi:hypothetical protein